MNGQWRYEDIKCVNLKANLDTMTCVKILTLTNVCY